MRRDGCIAWLGLTLALIAVCPIGPCLFPRSAIAQSVPAVPPPTCVVAFCPPGSLHPNMSIPCSSSGCECWDSCGQGGASSQRSGSSGGLSRALTAAIVATAKVAFLIAAPGHATESFGRAGETGQQAAQRYRQHEQERTALAQRGIAMAEEAEAFRRFQRAIRQRERDAHRHLLPLFRETPLGPPISRRDSQAQLRCVQAALRSAAEAVAAGVAGDISFLEARQAADIAAGAWDSGRAPADCAGSPAAQTTKQSPYVSYTPEQKRNFLADLSTQLASTLEVQRDLDQQETALQALKQQLADQRKRLQDEQEQKGRAAAQALEQAQREAQERQRTLDQAMAVEPPPAPLRSSKRPPPDPPPSDDPEDDLLRRLQQAKEQADVHVEATRRALQTAQDDAARSNQRFDQGADAQVRTIEDRLRNLNDKRGQALGALNHDFDILGLPAIALPPGVGSAPAPAAGDHSAPTAPRGSRP